MGGAYRSYQMCLRFFGSYVFAVAFSFPPFPICCLVGSELLLATSSGFLHSFLQRTSVTRGCRSRSWRQARWFAFSLIILCLHRKFALLSAFPCVRLSHLSCVLLNIDRVICVPENAGKFLLDSLRYFPVFRSLSSYALWPRSTEPSRGV